MKIGLFKNREHKTIIKADNRHVVNEKSFSKNNTNSIIFCGSSIATIVQNILLEIFADFAFISESWQQKETT